MTGSGAIPRFWRRLALATIALAVVAGLAGMQLMGTREPHARVSPVDAAREAVIDLMTYDHRTLDRDLDRALGRTTGEFREALEAGTAEHRAAFLELESVATAEVLEAAAISTDPDHASVLLFVDQTVTNRETGGKPRIDKIRVHVDVRFKDGHWLISAFDFK